MALENLFGLGEASKLHWRNGMRQLGQERRSLSIQLVDSHVRIVLLLHENSQLLPSMQVTSITPFS